MNRSKRKHVAVIDPAVRVAELDNYNRLVLSYPDLRFSFHLPAQFGMSSLQLLTEAPEALLIFGSGASVHDNLPWQPSLHEYIFSQANAALPTLGICYGHQLLAHLYGGKVAYATPDQYKYKGLRNVRFTRTGFWGQPGKTGDFIVSHREVVTELPEVFESFASSEITGIEGFAHKTLPIWGIQSHPEAGPDFLKNSEIPLIAEPKCFASGQRFLDGFFRQLSSQA